MSWRCTMLHSCEHNWFYRSRLLNVGVLSLMKWWNKRLWSVGPDDDLEEYLMRHKNIYAPVFMLLLFLTATFSRYMTEFVTIWMCIAYTFCRSELFTLSNQESSTDSGTSTVLDNGMQRLLWYLQSMCACRLFILCKQVENNVKPSHKNPTKNCIATYFVGSQQIPETTTIV